MAEKKKKKAATDEEKEHKKNWREVYASVGDIKAFLGGRLYLRHNVITGRVECRLPSNYETDGTDWQPISDRVVNSLWAELSQVKPVRAQDMYRVMESDFVEEYHPFRYYLDHLPPWDGQDYIIELSVSITIRGGVEKQMLFYEYLKKWLVAMVAGWVDESVVNNVILVLIGEQGSYKTTWFNYLLPPELKTYFYTKTNANRMGRDDLLTLAQYGLVCCEELDTMRPSELNQLKAAVTMPSIDAMSTDSISPRSAARATTCSSSATRRVTAAGCRSRWSRSARHVTIRSTMPASMRRHTRSIRRASVTGSHRTRYASSRSTTVPSRRPGRLMS